MKRFLALLLAACMMLCLMACKKKEAEETTTAATETTAQATTQETEPTTQPQTEPPTTAPVMYRNPLNGEEIDEPYTARPYAVMFNNLKAALPQHGISQADILYEVLAEGGITRCLGIFSDLSDVEKIGSVRSARSYYTHLAHAYDAIYVHAGGPESALLEISYTNLDDIDALKGYASSSFYRDQERLNRGVSLEHTLFTSGADLIECAQDRGYALERDEEIDCGLSFVEDGTPSKGEKAESVTVNFRSGGKKTIFTYNTETGLYEGYQQGGDYIDGNTGETVCFSNLLMVYFDTSTNAGGTLSINTCGAGDGYYACGGKIILITWKRGGLEKPFSYFLEDGTPLEVSVGTTYIAVLPGGSPVDYE